ncbi:MAG: hypothetical protein OK449_10540 [Thaumarchaeota archaeon]|nr:hypothetical protein [Nitrososphaerota archaeon]
MAEAEWSGFDSLKFSRIGPVLAVLVDIREEEILSLCRELLDTAFPDSAGKHVIAAMLRASGTMSLREIASGCDRGRRAIMPDGELRAAVERMAREGIIVNKGTPEKPRYSLDGGDRRVQMLRRMYGPMRFGEAEI